MNASTVVGCDEMLIVGLDLAGVESRPTGFCVLRELEAETFLAYEDVEIVERISSVKPKVVAIDAPLSLPKGRTSIEERTSTHLRECDKELLKMGSRFFPITLGPMRKLTTRGMKLKKILEDKHFRVIEVYPGGAQDVLGIPRKQKGINRVMSGLKELKVEGLTQKMSDHELDAVTCAYVGKLFLEGNARVYGTPEQAIIMPDV